MLAGEYGPSPTSAAPPHPAGRRHLDGLSILRCHESGDVDARRTCACLYRRETRSGGKPGALSRERVSPAAHAGEIAASLQLFCLGGVRQNASDGL